MSPSTGVINSHEYMTSLHGIVEEHGGSVALQSKVNQLEHRDGLNYVLLDNFELACNICVNAAGLAAPTLALDTQSTNWSVPNPYYARGHYYSYSGQAPFSRLIYPVAEPGGLGVHVTLDIAGQVKFGPDVQWIDEIDYSFDGRDKANFVDAIRKYYPAIEESRLHPSYTGIRPKISPPGSEFTDFRIDLPKHHGLAGRVNLLGIESPGLTASLAIAEYVAAHISVDNN